MVLEKLTIVLCLVTNCESLKNKGIQVEFAPCCGWIGIWCRSNCEGVEMCRVGYLGWDHGSAAVPWDRISPERTFTIRPLFYRLCVHSQTEWTLNKIGISRRRPATLKLSPHISHSQLLHNSPSPFSTLNTPWKDIFNRIVFSPLGGMDNRKSVHQTIKKISCWAAAEAVISYLLHFFLFYLILKTATYNSCTFLLIHSKHNLSSTSSSLPYS